MHGYPPPGWPSWPTHSPGHSVELEHRLTQVEERQLQNLERHEEHEERASDLSRRMTLHERAILAILAVLQVLMQDKWPALAELLKGMRP